MTKKQYQRYRHEFKIHALKRASEARWYETDYTAGLRWPANSTYQCPFVFRFMILLNWM